jgi:hypothetical protein
VANRQLQVRLPNDHWIWEAGNALERRRQVIEALDFYRRFHSRMDEVVAAVAEIRKMLLDGSVGLKQSEQGRKESQTDDRLLAAVDKFLAVDKLLGF